MSNKTHARRRFIMYVFIYGMCWCFLERGRGLAPIRLRWKAKRLPVYTTARLLKLPSERAVLNSDPSRD